MALSATPHEHVARMLDEIHRRYNERLTLASLARLLSRQAAYLGRLFQREVGVTVHEYVTRARMESGAAQVRAGVKIEAIAMELGYRSKKNFYRQFKRRFGMTPDAYRQENGDGARSGTRHRSSPGRAQAVSRILTGSSVAMLVTDERGRYVGATEAAVALTGYAIHELRGMRADVLFPDAARASMRCRLQVLRPPSLSRPPTCAIHTKTGDSVQVHLTSVELADTLTEPSMHLAEARPSE
jgi:PAS domain S-box-containing protein